MTKHRPECWAKHPSDPEAWCICDELHACEKRVTAHERSWENAVIIARAGYQDGHAAALDAAKKTVAAIPAEYKVRGDYDSYGPYAEGKADFKDLALSAIDTLRKEQQ